MLDIWYFRLGIGRYVLIEQAHSLPYHPVPHRDPLSWDRTEYGEDQNIWHLQTYSEEKKKLSTGNLE